jgi:hypothetical protein
MMKLWIVMGLALLVPIGAAWGEDADRAVEKVNGEVGALYNYGKSKQGKTSVGASVITLPSASAHEPVVYARLTVPLGDHFGARLTALGAFQRSKQAGEKGKSYAVSGGADLFWRNPSLGYTNAGYNYTWIDLPDGLKVTSHGGDVSAGIFFPEMGIGDLDWAATFEYARNRYTGPGISHISFDTYAVRTGPNWYLTETFLASPSFTWSRTEQSSDYIQSQISGYLGINWLIGPPSGRYVSIGAYGSYGNATTNAPKPFSDIDQKFYTLGTQLSIYITPIKSFMQLIRHRQ